MKRPPQQRVPVVSMGGILGYLTDEWVRWLESLFALPSASEPAIPTGSPFLRSFDRNGTYVVQGGTVSLIEYGRGSGVVSLIPLGVTQGPIPVRRGDTIQVTYTVAPNITFLPD